MNGPVRGVQFVAEVTTAVVVIVLAVRKRSDKRIEALIKDQTQLIQPGYRNGGASLEDLSEKPGRSRETVRTPRDVASGAAGPCHRQCGNGSDLAARVDENRDTAIRRPPRHSTSTVERNAEAAAEPV